MKIVVQPPPIYKVYPSGVNSYRVVVTQTILQGLRAGGAVDVEVTDYTKGLILKSPNGTRARVTLNDDLTLTVTEL